MTREHEKVDDIKDDATVQAEIGLPVAANEDHLRLLEAILFAATTPLTPHAIRERMPENADVGGLLMELKSRYEGRGVCLSEFDGMWALRTATDLSGSLDIKKDVQRRLSRAAMETMAIIAYHQPVTRAEIENIRGVIISKGTIDVLVEAGWVKPGRRREAPGRPLTWVTTPAFLDHFGLESQMDLPGMDELKASGLLDRRPAIDAATGSLFGAEDDMLEEDLEDPEDDRMEDDLDDDDDDVSDDDDETDDELLDEDVA